MPRLLVPMLSVQKNEVRAFFLDPIYQVHGGFECTGTLDGDPFGEPWVLDLPPGVDYIGDLPQFENSDECYDYIRKTWPHLQP